MRSAGDPKDEVAETLFNRAEVFAKRRSSQIQTVDFPTTSIGSFPQTTGTCPLLRGTRTTRCDYLRFTSNRPFVL